MLLQKLERASLKAIRKVLYGDKLPKKNLSFLCGEDLNKLILKSIEGEKPFMVARFGSIEFNSSIYPYLVNRSLLERYRMYVQGKIDFINKSDDYERSLITPLCNNAGFFPDDCSLLSRYSALMLEDVRQMDCCCCSSWIREDILEDHYNDGIKFAQLNDMEPYDYQIPWSKALTGKKVLVVHPFSKSIEAQYTKRELLWENRDVLPDFELHTIKAVQSIAGEAVPYNTWFDALDDMKLQMDSVDYGIAIIGCGAYGFHLAAHAKRMGKKAIHLGGATQILFGIKGKRWDEIPAVSKFYNEYWVYPSKDETPKNRTSVEGGCYW